MRRRRHIGAAAGVALVLLVAACGGADDGQDGVMTTSSTAEPASEPAPSTSATPANFSSSVDGVTAGQLGASWTEGIGCTASDQLAMVTVSHHGFDGAVHEGRIIVAVDAVDDIVAVFSELFDAEFPIERMEPVSVFDGDDDASMAANNSSGYNCRTVAGTSSLSDHAFGSAVDINPLMNPWVHDGVVDPPEGEAYTDRSRHDPGIIHADDAVVRAFAAQGWAWGGDWAEPDYQHFYRP